jgi:hypothetical protein
MRDDTRRKQFGPCSDAGALGFSDVEASLKKSNLLLRSETLFQLPKT